MQALGNDQRWQSLSMLSVVGAGLK